MGRKSSYTQEFKTDALNLAKKVGLSQAAEDLGVSPATLRRWKSEKVKPVNSSDETDLLKENARLKKELEYLKKINEVLKKSHAIFSSDHHPSSKS